MNTFKTFSLLCAFLSGKRTFFFNCGREEGIKGSMVVAEEGRGRNGYIYLGFSLLVQDIRIFIPSFPKRRNSQVGAFLFGKFSA